jgi:hypothetical protein
MPSIGRGPKGALRRVKRDIIKINSKDISAGDSKCAGDSECTTVSVRQCDYRSIRLTLIFL